VERPFSESLQLPDAARREADTGAGDEVLDCAGDEDLAGPAWAATRAPTATARPASFPSTTSHSPVWRPTRISRPSDVTASRIAHPQRIARAGPSNPDAKEAVARCVDRLAAEARELAPDRCVVPGEQRRPVAARLHGLRRRVDEIVKSTVASTRRRSTARRCHASTTNSAISRYGIQSKRATSTTRLSWMCAAR